VERTLKSSGVLLAMVAVAALFPRVPPTYAAAIGSAGFLMLGLVALRPVVRIWAGRRNVVGTLILGSENQARRLYEEFAEREQLRPVHVIDYGHAEKLANLFHPGNNVSSIVLADAEGLGARDDVASALIDCKLRGVKIETPVESFERRTQKIWLKGLSAEWLILANGFQPSALYPAAKRILDVAAASLLSIVATPVALLITIAIKLDSEGPAIFKQERVGLRGRNFTLYKFRSMHIDAEKDGPVWTQEHDSRVTRVGRFLRVTRLDELPQLFNVIRGDMSLVGPRPERPYFVELLKSKIRFYNVRHYVKPGVTGWAQVMYPYGASVEDSYEKLQYDLYYAKNISLRLDLKILLKTVAVVLAGGGR
jgi:exopolysaccharide biosynthesis polyprenyl glycosylphosphotransferase